MGVVPISLRDVLTINPRHNRAAASKVVLVYPDEDKGRDDQQEQQAHHPLGVLAYGFQHGESFNGCKRKGELAFAFVWGGGC